MAMGASRYLAMFRASFPPPNVGCSHHEIRDGPLLEVPGEHTNGCQLIQRYVEKALYLAGVQVHGQHPVGS